LVESGFDDLEKGSSTVDLSIIITTYNREKTLSRLFHSLKEASQVDIPLEIVVVNNNPAVNLLPMINEAIQRFSLPLRCLSESGPGKSYALNSGIQSAQGEFVAFLDDDVIVHEDYFIGIKKTISTFSYNTFGGRVFPIFPYSPPDWASGGKSLTTTRGPIVAHDYGDQPRPYDKGMRRPIGCNFFCRRLLFERYGLFDVRFGRRVGDSSFLIAGEENDLLRRFQEGGEILFYTPFVVVDHPVEPERMTKAHFRYRLFTAGRSVPYFAKTTFPSFFGIPRYLYRRLITIMGQGILALISFRSLKAFDRQLDFYEIIGAMYEYWRIHKINSPH
jgi:glycosyltransferase involved in cell wall biosynthesis